MSKPNQCRQMRGLDWSVAMVSMVAQPVTGGVVSCLSLHGRLDRLQGTSVAPCTPVGCDTKIAGKGSGKTEERTRIVQS